MREWREASDTEWSIAREREAVIRPLAMLDKLSDNDVQAADRLGISRSTLYRLLGRFQPRATAQAARKRRVIEASWVGNFW